jgi:hypothetical protein
MDTDMLTAVRTSDLIQFCFLFVQRNFITNMQHDECYVCVTRPSLKATARLTDGMWLSSELEKY